MQLPLGTNYISYLAAVIIEALLFLMLVYLSGLSFANYQKHKMGLRLNVFGICAGYSITLLLLVVGDASRYYETNIFNLMTEINYTVILLTNCLFWNFYLSVFRSESSTRKLWAGIYFIVVGLALLANYFVPNMGYELYVLLFLASSFVLFIGLMVSSHTLLPKIENRLDKISTQLLFITGLLLALSYLLTITTSALESAPFNLIPDYSILYILSAILGGAAFLLLYISFFHPTWYKLRIMHPDDVPSLSNDLQLSTYHDDLPQLTEEELKVEKEAFEWWYFDLEFSDSQSIVAIFARRDRTVDDKKPSIHLEYHDGDLILNRIEDYAANTFRVIPLEENGGTEIDFGPNWIRIYQEEERITRYVWHLDMKALKAEFDCIPAHQGFKPNKDGCYFIHKTEPNLKAFVNFASPRIHGKGQIVVNGSLKDFEGDGYHDHPWGTVPLLFTHQKWHWARLFNDQMSIMFAEVTPVNDYYGQLKFMYLGQIGQNEPTLITNFTIDATDYKKEKTSLAFPHQLILNIPEGKQHIQTNYIKLLSDLQVYLRSQVKFMLTPNDQEGIGWVEYAQLPLGMKGLMQSLNRLKYKGWKK